MLADQNKDFGRTASAAVSDLLGSVQGMVRLAG